MLKKIIRTIYFGFISIVLITIIFTVWTTYAFVTQSSKSIEITHVIQDVYTNQKSIVIDIIDLSRILIKDTSELTTIENDNIQLEKELQTDLEDNFQLDESLMTEDNGDNPLGIVIEPSEASQESLFNEEKDDSITGIDMDF